MLLLYVGNRNLLTPIVVETINLILLDGLLWMHFLETVWSRLVVHDFDEMGNGLGHCVRERFTVFIEDYFKKRWASYRDTVLFC